MATLDMAGIITRVCTKLKDKFAPIAIVPTVNSALQPSSLKTINNTSLVGSGNISITGLPAVTASDNGKVATVVNGAWAAGEGGGSGFLLTVSGSNTQGYTLDKTGREIIDAVNAGIAPVFKNTNAAIVYIYPLVSVEYTPSAGTIKVRSSGWGNYFTAVGFDNYPSIPAQGGGDN